MPNLIGPDVLAVLGKEHCPPPGAVGILRKVKKGVRKAGRIAKKGGKIAVKIHTKPIKLVAKAGKFALLKAAKLAATPIRLMFRKLAMRRAKLLSWQRRKSMAPDRAEKSMAVTWAIERMNRKGPLGKFGVRILKFTKGATLGLAVAENPRSKALLAALRDWHHTEHDLKDAAIKAAVKGFPVSVLGLTGAEIAAAAASIAGAIAAIMQSLNRPGEAPADPRASEPTPQAEEAEQAVDEANEDATTGGWLK